MQQRKTHQQDSNATPKATRKPSWEYQNLAWKIQFPAKRLGAKLALLFLAKAANDRGESHHSYNSIAAHCSISCRSVSRSLRYLDTLKVVVWMTGRGGTEQGTNRYKLDLQMMRGVIKAQGVFDPETLKIIRNEGHDDPSNEGHDDSSSRQSEGHDDIQATDNSDRARDNSDTSVGQQRHELRTPCPTNVHRTSIERPEKQPPLEHPVPPTPPGKDSVCLSGMPDGQSEKPFPEGLPDLPEGYKRVWVGDDIQEVAI